MDIYAIPATCVDKADKRMANRRMADIGAKRPFGKTLTWLKCQSHEMVWGAAACAGSRKAGS